MIEQEVRFPVPEASVRASGLLNRPDRARWLLVLAHGAGAGMRHPFMRELSEAVADHGIATLRYMFPYMEEGSRRPDPQPTLLATVRAAVEAARGTAGDLPLLAGGKSMGGRMTTLAAAQRPLPGVRGLVLFGFPLHPAGRPGVGRGEHLARVGVPMLFLQGTRDSLADLDLVRGVLGGLGARATLEVIEGADHSFHVLKRSGRTDAEVLSGMARRVARWVAPLA